MRIIRTWSSCSIKSLFAKAVSGPPLFPARFAALILSLFEYCVNSALYGGCIVLLSSCRIHMSGLLAGKNNGSAKMNNSADDEKLSWTAILKKYAIRECKICTSMIANDGRYGRPASKADPALCDVCRPQPLFGIDAPGII